MQVVSALNSLESDLAGKYFPLTGMSEADRLDLVQSHFLFKRGDRFLESAGANRDWPGLCVAVLGSYRECGRYFSLKYE